MTDKPAAGPLDTQDLGKVAHEVTERLRGMTEQLQAAGKTGLDALGFAAAPLKHWLSLMEAVTAQATLPLAQLEALVNGIRAQREQVHALQAQLSVFDKQLAALEGSLLPLVNWAKQWVGMQESVLRRLRDPLD